MKNKILLSAIFLLMTGIVVSQNPLVIPPALTGNTFDLNIQTGTQNYFAGNPTPTYGVNGPILAPTLIMNKGDNVTINVHNGLPVQTTMHWHGFHVSAENDGGPHQMINAGDTWSPNFDVLNDAATYWYHPHGAGKTELHVSKGIAGLIIVRDNIEAALNLPRTYGIDDIPLIVQAKSFDVLNQVSVGDHMDTSLFVNGTLNAYFDAPAQVVRFRLLNGSSMRTFNFGFSNGMSFSQIAVDGGLLANSLPLTRLLIAPGERAEILVDFSALNGQSIQLMSYASEMTDGIFGAPNVGIAPDVIDMYSDNFLNGADFTLMDINIVSPTTTPIPVTTIPTTLATYTPYDVSTVDVNRTFILDTLRLLPMDVPNLAAGPFGINNATFSMGTINVIVPLNSTEIWSLINKTHIAHPFHVHDIQFNVIEKNGQPPAPSETGWKDVILVMPHDSVKFITKFTDFSDSMMPYMYHCHLLHHEDDGMMGTFLVVDPNASIPEKQWQESGINIFPNPSKDIWNIAGKWNKQKITLEVTNLLGQTIYSKKYSGANSSEILSIQNSKFESGLYLLTIKCGGEIYTTRLEKE